MPVTLTDEQANALRAEFGRLQRNAAIGERATKIWNSPKNGDRAKQLWKDEFPEDQIEGFDLEQRITARLDAERKAREDAEKAAREKAEDERTKTQRAETQRKYGLTDDAMKRMEDEMVARNVGDYEVAATWFASREPRPAEDPGSTHFWNHDQRDGFKEVVKDPEGWAFGQIHQAVVNDAQARGIR